jgi:hypothetical protein
MEPSTKDYQSYLLRMWRVKDEAGGSWRATLEEVHSGELLGFPGLAALLGYLEALGCVNQREGEAVLEGQPD